MKRNERTIYNSLKKTVTADTIYVEIPTAWTHEARQAIHELLTVSKRMRAVCIGPRVTDFVQCIRYAKDDGGSDPARQWQEAHDIDTVMASLHTTDRTFTGYKVTADSSSNDNDSSKEEEKKMKKTTSKNTLTPAEEAARQAANARRLEKMRATLAALEARADAILAKGDAMTAADRRELITLLNIAYHTGASKIEGIFSIDGSASCEFCQQMQQAALDNLLIICGLCYAAADEFKEASWRRHKLNARILSSVLFTEEELSWLTLPQRADVRINEDGDTANETHGRNIIRIFRVFPGCNFGYWFKNTPAVDAALHAEGYHRREDLPRNVRFVQSSLLIGFEAKPVWFADCIFTVYPDEETTAAAIAAGAYECNGRRCRACGFHCYRPDRSSDKVIYIAEVLRASKARRAQILAAYHARKARIAKAG